MITALRSRAPGPSDKSGQVTVPRSIFCEQYHSEPVGEKKFAANDEKQVACTSSNMRSDNARNAALIGQGKRPITEGICLPYQFLWM